MLEMPPYSFITFVCIWIYLFYIALKNDVSKMATKGLAGFVLEIVSPHSFVVANLLKTEI